MNYPQIEFTITCSKRLDLFIITINSFLENCLDTDLISRWILSDDHSDSKDLETIKQLYPFFEIYNSPGKGQAYNLNNLFSKVTTEWFFHCEDDWLFFKKDHFIRKAFDVASSDPRIKNVVLREWNGPYVKIGDLEYRMHAYHPNGSIHIMPWNDWRWFGYSLNPGLQHLPTVKLIGEYPTNAIGLPHPRYFDRPPAIAYRMAGYLRANLMEGYIEHIGKGRSVYEG